jgi:hypothetical protein
MSDGMGCGTELDRRDWDHRASSFSRCVACNKFSLTPRKRNPIKIYKKCLDETTTLCNIPVFQQHFTIPTVMRLSVLALFTALPAVVYAGVGFPLNGPKTPSCGANEGYYCNLLDPSSCCPPAVCSPVDPSNSDTGVRLFYSAFSPIRVGY